jgi:hypothetical protein
MRCLTAGAVLAGLLAGAWAVEDDPDQFEKVVVTTIQGDVVNTIYQKRPWRVIKAEDLLDKKLTGQEVCAELKFSVLEGERLELFAQKGKVICRDQEQLKKAAKLKRGDNFWVCGMLEEGEDKQPRLVVSTMIQLPGDYERLNRRYEGMLRKEQAELLVKLGDEIGQNLTLNFYALDEQERIEKLRIQCYTQGLKLMEDQLTENDADGRVKLALLFEQKLKRQVKRDGLVRAALALDPDHPQASVLAVKIGLRKVGRKWMTQTEYEAHQQEIERLLALEAEERQRKLRELRRRFAEELPLRERKLTDGQAAIRSSNPKARAGAMLSLGQAAAQSADPVFGARAVRILAQLGEAGAFDGLAAAAECQYPGVRTEVYEALSWRLGEGSARAKLTERLLAEAEAEPLREALAALLRRSDKLGYEELHQLLAADKERLNIQIIEALRAAQGRDGNRQFWLQWLTQQKN